MTESSELSGMHHPDSLRESGPDQPYAGEEPYSEVQSKEKRDHPDVQGSEEEERAS